MEEGDEDQTPSVDGGTMEEGDLDASSKLRERLFRNQRENRFQRRDPNERKTMEEVFDKATNFALDQIMNKGDLAYLNGVVRSGKEARVYWGVAPDGTPRAVKIYLTASAEFKKRLRYVAGDRRFQELPHSVRAMIKLWVQKEYKNLQLASEAGIRVPKLYAIKENILVMEYIGEPPSPAPTYAESEVNETDYRWTVRMIKNLYRRAHLIHADLSEYNIFKTREKRVLFDMGSAILTSHPEANAFLLRDVTNIVRFFKKRGIFEQEPDEIVEEIAT